MRYDEAREVYRDCRWCAGRGCLYCKAERDRAYARVFPEAAQPIVSVDTSTQEGMERARRVLGAEAMQHAFGPSGRGAAEIIENAILDEDVVEFFAVYKGSDGDATKALYARLAALGPVGLVAVNLFRACKTSERAKGYRRRAHKSASYDRKQWSMDNLAKVLGDHAEALSLGWGWAEDPAQEYHRWVLYIELPTGQVSFHTDARGLGPDFPNKWDGVRDAAPTRICKWIATLFAYANE